MSTKIPPGTPPEYSTLEVDQNRWLETQHNSAPEIGHDPRNEKIYAEQNTYPIPVSEASGAPAKKPTICGFRRKTFWILLGIAVIAVVAIAIGGGVGGAVASNSRKSSSSVNAPTSTPNTPPSTTSSSVYQNTGLAAMQWTDQSGTNHYRVYYQDKANVIQESAWDSDSSGWQVAPASGSNSNVKPGTPIAAAAGYPHASYDYPVAKNVYYMSTNDQLYERQAPANNSHAWENDNFSGQYSGTNNTRIAAYWNQNMKNESQELIVLFQEPDFANGLTMGKYTSNITSSYPWVANKFGFATPDGSSFALSNTGTGKNLMLYAINNNGKLMQNEYLLTDDLDTNVLSATSTDTGITPQPKNPLAVVTQDNTPLYSTDLLPECSKSRPLTHLIVYTAPDRSSLNLNLWNCTDGFVNFTSKIQPLVKPKTTYLGLASHRDGKLYVLLDQGAGPEIEEWTVPKYSGDVWSSVRNVSTNFSA